MNELFEINIKSDGQTVDQALGEFLIELDRLNFCDAKIMKIITGYGSHGRGGEIKKALLRLLCNLKRDKKIADFYPCEKLSKEILSALCAKYPSIILDYEISNYNSGVVVVELVHAS